MNRIPHNKYLVFQATWAAIAIAICLITAKIFAWQLSGSLTIQATLLDSISDFFSSLVNFFAVRYSARPANDEYRFGHGKAEALAGFVQSLFIIASAGWIIFNGYHQRNMLNHTEDHPLAIKVMVFSVILTLALVLFQYHTIKRTNSVAIKADFLHYRADLLSNSAAILALLSFSQFNTIWIDIVFGICIVLFLLSGSCRILKQSFSILMDKELSDSVRKSILECLVSHPNVIEAHDLRTRSTGQQNFIQVHITLAPTISLAHAHTISDEVEKKLKEIQPDSEILIHLDPLGYKPLNEIDK